MMLESNKDFSRVNYFNSVNKIVYIRRRKKLFCKYQTQVRKVDSTRLRTFYSTKEAGHQGMPMRIN